MNENMGVKMSCVNAQWAIGFPLGKGTSCILHCRVVTFHGSIRIIEDEYRRIIIK